MAGNGQGGNFPSMQTGGACANIAELLLMAQTGQVNPPALGKRLNPLFDPFIKAIALFQALLDLVVHVGRHSQRTVELTEHIELANARKV